jgi:hypothetical protein
LLLLLASTGIILAAGALRLVRASCMQRASRKTFADYSPVTHLGIGSASGAMRGGLRVVKWQGARLGGWLSCLGEEPAKLLLLTYCIQEGAMALRSQNHGVLPRPRAHDQPRRRRRS